MSTNRPDPPRHSASVAAAAATAASALGVALAVVGCTTGSATECRSGADCPSGVCDVSGQCRRGDPSTDAGGAGAASSDAPAPGSSSDASPSDAPPPSDAPADGPKPPGCVARRDGVIRASELPVALGARVTFRVAQGTTVDTAGTKLADGRRRWDFSAAIAGDRTLLFEVQPLAGTWFEAKFPGATYAQRLSGAQELMGVFESTPEALLLAGVVSPSDGLTSTQVTYATPIPAARFPLTVGKSWRATSRVSGRTMGVVAAYTESYDFEVDAAGDVVTPLGTFPALRVRATLKQTLGIFPKTVRSFAFITECFGQVAYVASKDDERDAEFTSAAELRRVAP